MNSTEFSIRLENIGKCYRIYSNPQDRFKQALRDRFGQWLGKQQHPPLYREHWALRDLSFELAPGEAMGILGRNGAGKSTLLQIICGTLAPTTGKVETAGRITALLELGSGFNPEFTGRENVFHNAQILGLTKSETENKFDDIAGFADIGDFIDQPVKTYSSGMMMRLAFAVQTAVEPQILIVDEALSVGDMFFQAKCMARINSLVDNGVSLLFVSHDLSSIRHLCKRALLISNGQMEYFGDAAEATSRYERYYLSGYNDRAESVKKQKQESNQENGAIVPVANSKSDTASPSNPVLLEKLKDASTFLSQANFERFGNEEARILNVVMLGESGEPQTVFDFGEKVRLVQLVRFGYDSSDINVSYKIKTVQGVSIVFGDTRMYGDISKSYFADNEYIFVWEFDLKMGHGSYVIQSTLTHPPRNGADWEFVDCVPISHTFQVLPRKEGMTDGLVSWDTKHEVFLKV